APEPDRGRHRRDHAGSHRPLLRPLSIEEIAPADERLPGVFDVMRELRTHLSLDDFRRLYQESHPEGYRVAALFEGDEPRAVAGYRFVTNLISGKHIYVDDLV